MMGEHLANFECFACKTHFQPFFFALSRQFERIDFDRDGGIDVEQAEGLTRYCTNACLQGHYPSVMAEQQVPIPALRPGYSAVERCAVCSGPVDMTRFHLTYTLEYSEDRGWCVQPIEVENVAVVCQKCAPFTFGVSLATDHSSDHERALSPESTELVSLPSPT